jgi:uncharacterized linocin/CFP29 family protein
MNNLHRELAPISSEAWTAIEEEARRTFTRHVAGRRVVDVIGPKGLTLAAVGTGHLASIDSPVAGVSASRREVQPVIELQAPFVLRRADVDDVERGARDSDWQPVKDAARQIAFAEDGAIFEGFASGNISGIRVAGTNPPVPLPADVKDYPNAVAQAVSALRLAGVNGPYTLLLGAEAFTAVSETADHGYPIHEHLARVLDGEIIWAPAIDGAFVLSTRGGDYELHLGEDLSIGYLAHDRDTVELYLRESLTFIVQAGEAGVALTAGPSLLA